MRITVAAFVITTTLPAQNGEPGWVSPSYPRPASQTGMVFDEARGRLVLYGGAKFGGTNDHDTWEWDGSAWVWRRPPVSPTAWEGAGMAYDSARQRTVLFGGRFVNAANPAMQITNETWEWDGFAWEQRTPVTSPSPRHRHATAYDEARQRVVLFGGNRASAQSAPSDETWEWDGTTWTQLQPAQRPTARQDHTMVYDRARGQVLLYGGRQDGFPFVEFDDTWAWDGTNWTRLFPDDKPGERYGHSMSYDSVRQRVVLFGGADRRGIGTVTLRGTWEWNGTTWLPRSQGTGPEAPIGHSMAYDPVRQRTVLFGGQSLGRDRGDTWEWNGAVWTLRSAPPVEPPADDAVLVFDKTRQRTTLFGAAGETWDFDGTVWQKLAPPVSPPPRTGFDMVWDSAKARVLLFGGWGSPLLADTWEWDGLTWSLQQPPASPSPRDRHGMAYDSERGRAVLFGGHDGTFLLDETWEWDGTTWTQRTPDDMPGARFGPGMAYDPVRGRVVLFGGSTSGGAVFYYDDTWEWDGTTWWQRSPSVSPSPRVYPALTWDEARQRVVLFGGAISGSVGVHNDTWEWDGEDWTRIENEGPRPGPRFGVGIAFDENLQRTVLFGGAGGFAGGHVSGTWTYGTGLAASESFDVGCTGTLGRPFLGSFDPASLGRQSFALDLVRARPSAPAVVLVAAAPGSVPLGGDCALLVNLASPWFALSGVTNTAGTATFGAPLPATPSLAGQTVWGQAAIVDPLGAWQGLAFSGPVVVTLGL